MKIANASRQLKKFALVPKSTVNRLASPSIVDEYIKSENLPQQTQAVPPILDSRSALELKSPELERPVLMVHGLAQKSDNWVGFKNFLDGNPENHWGGVFRASERKQFREGVKNKPEAKMFAIDLSDNLASPETVAREVSEAISAIIEATGSDKVDLVTHSMGGLVAREAVRQGERRIGKLAMLAPPSQGAFEANLAVKAAGLGVYQHYPEDRMGAMSALQLEYGPLGGVANPWLHQLNEFWEKTEDKPESIVVTGVGVPTPDRELLPGLAPGDGMVSANKAALKGEPLYLALPGQLETSDPNYRDFQQLFHNHLAILNAPDVFALVGNFLTDTEPNKS